tara:strand:- start:1601 stop:2566 length:966 start_codon:yes stop_codon:yes gene_type:complete
MAEPKSISQARKMGKSYFIGKDGKRKAAVTKEELDESRLSLRDYLNKQRKARRTGADLSASKPTAKSEGKKEPSPTLKSKSKKYVGSSQRPDNRPVKSTPKSKYRPRGSSAPLGGKADPYKYVGTGPRGQKGQAPVPTTEEKIAMGGLLIGNLGGPGAKVAIKAATTYGKPFINQLIRKIKDLSNKEQEDILKSVSRSKLSKKEVTEAIKNAESPHNILAEVARQKSAISVQRASGEPLFKSTVRQKNQAARNRKRRQETKRKKELEKMNEQAAGSTRIPGAKLRKKGGPIKKYNEGGKVVNRKGGGQVMSGSDLVSSLYD